MFTLKQLSYLVALADEKHFSRAAATCHVSQPTLSHQVQLLEEQLGITLLERDRKQLKLTNAGEAVVAKAKTMLQLQQEIIQQAQLEHSDPLATTLTLGVIPTIAPYWLPQILAQLATNTPQLKLRIYEDQTSRLLGALHTGEVDCALLALPVAGDEKFRTETLYHEPFWVALPPQHRLASKQQIKLTDINPQELLLLEEGHCLREHALEACKLAKGTAGNANVRASSLETLKHLVSHGQGLTLLPEQATHSGVEKLVIKPLAQPAERVIGLVWRTSDPRLITMRQLSELLQKV